MASKWIKLLNTPLLKGGERERRLRRYPVLAEFADEARGQRAFSAAQRTVTRKPRYLVVRLLVMLTLFGVLTLHAFNLLGNGYCALVCGLLLIILDLEFRRQRPRMRMELQRLLRHDQLHCHECDYSLIGNTSGRCPECGTDIPTDQRRLISNRYDLGLEIAPDPGVECKK